MGYKRVILKVGTSSLINNDGSLNFLMFNSIMSGIKKLNDIGIIACLVTSGAIAVGMKELNISKRPNEMALKQACASVGQAKLMEVYNTIGSNYNLITGQILVNHDDFGIRKRMIHLANTLDEMLKNNIVPIINENDALAVDEIKIGDNDTLAALIAPMINADLLILFSDIDGFYDKNPKLYNDARLINVVESINERILSMANNTSSSVGTGGMITKLSAAVIATHAACDMIICNSNKMNNLVDIVNGDKFGTLFKANEKCISSREHWMIFKANGCGSIVVDKGFKSLYDEKRISILPKGIKAVIGEFLRNSVVNIIDETGAILAKGISNYSSTEIDQIKGINSGCISSVLGYSLKEEIVHANNLVKIVNEDSYYEWFINKSETSLPKIEGSVKF